LLWLPVPNRIIAAEMMLVVAHTAGGFLGPGAPRSSAQVGILAHSVPARFPKASCQGSAKRTGKLGIEKSSSI